MDRFYLAPDQWGGNTALTGDEAHHCTRVMRKRAGDELIVFDGWGREADAVIVQASRNEVALEIGEIRERDTLRPQIELAVGIPKGKTFDLILQKAVELGVMRIYPLMSEQGNVRISADEVASKCQKWQRTVLEACKQCGQNFLPEVMMPQGVEDYLKGLEVESLRLVAALTPQSQPMRELLVANAEPSRVSLLIGPEGDFSVGEYELIEAHDFQAVSLGELVLRTETAVFFMVSSVRYQFQS